MALTAREFWTVGHGMILGSFVLLAFASGLTGLRSHRPEVTAEGFRNGLAARRPRWPGWAPARSRAPSTPSRTCVTWQFRAWPAQ
jgi:hypothetical protein